MISLYKFSCKPTPSSRAYCEDESRKLMHITDIFTEEWRRLDLGANIVAEYIHFCQYKPEFPPAFFKSVNLVIRSILLDLNLPMHWMQSF